MAATTVEGKIADLLLTRLGTLTLDPVLPVAWPNTDFDSTAGAYLEPQELPNRTVNLFLAANDPDMYQGIFQIDLVYAARDGIIKPKDIAGKVADHFDKGTRLSGSGIVLKIDDRPDTARGLREATHLRIPISVRYRVFA